jgi:hypothetical protein
MSGWRKAGPKPREAFLWNEVSYARLHALTAFLDAKLAVGQAGKSRRMKRRGSTQEVVFLHKKAAHSPYSSQIRGF